MMGECTYKQNKKYPPYGKWRIPIFRHHCLNSSIILSWLYLGINRKPYKCIPPDLRKNLAEAESFLHLAQFCMKNPAKNEGGQNKWSEGCPRRRRKQKWHDGEKTFTKTAFYYVDKESLVKFNGFLAPKAEGSYLILNEGGYQIEGQTDTWKVIDEKNVQEQRFVQLVCEQTKKQRPDIILHDSGVLVAQTIYGFDSSVMKKIEKFLREQKPELLHYQKFLENGTAERAKESGTEQNYNMIDGCVNNNPKKPRIIGNRISVLDRLHIKLEERKQKSQPQQQQQQERSRKN